MAVTSLDTVHMAVYDALAAHVGLSVLVGSRIYDTLPPQGSAFPRIVLSAPTETPFDALNQQYGNTNTLLIHLWSQDAATSGNATVAAMYQGVKDALDHVPLTLSTGRTITGRTEFITSQLDPDFISMHGIARYQAQGRVS